MIMKLTDNDGNKTDAINGFQKKNNYIKIKHYRENGINDHDNENNN